MNGSKILQKLLLEFCSNPENFWGENTRQLKKFKNRHSSLLNFYNYSQENLVDFILSAAAIRVKEKVPTLYIPSFGSSGSHLVQDILANFQNSIPLGEVYIAPTLVEKVSTMDQTFKRIFIEAYCLLYSGSLQNTFKLVPIINTAHKPSLLHFGDFSSCYRSCLLVRDPLQIVISRTFRKDEFRSYMHKKGISDLDYMKENIDKTKRFFRAALNFKHEFSVKYEDIVCESNDAINSLLEFTNMRGEIDKMKMSFSHSLHGSDKTNLFKGERKVIDESYLSYIKNELHDLRTVLGYL